MGFEACLETLGVEHILGGYCGRNGGCDSFSQFLFNPQEPAKQNSFLCLYLQSCMNPQKHLSGIIEELMKAVNYTICTLC